MVNVLCNVYCFYRWHNVLEEIFLLYHVPLILNVPVCYHIILLYNAIYEKQIHNEGQLLKAVGQRSSWPSMNKIDPMISDQKIFEVWIYMYIKSTCICKKLASKLDFDLKDIILMYTTLKVIHCHTWIIAVKSANIIDEVVSDQKIFEVLLYIYIEKWSSSMTLTLDITSIYTIMKDLH
jgi:hypothetical protein